MEEDEEEEEYLDEDEFDRYIEEEDAIDEDVEDDENACGTSFVEALLCIVLSTYHPDQELDFLFKEGPPSLTTLALVVMSVASGCLFVHELLEIALYR